MHDDDPGDAVHDVFAGALLGDSPLGRPILGTVASIEDMPRDRLAEYYRARYTAPRTVVAVSGAIDHDEVVRAVADAFARIARVPLAPPVVHASPEHGYRLRVRLHVREGRLGSFREGTHEVCDVRSTGQVLPETAGVVEALHACLRAHDVARLEAVEIAENLDASQRVVHLDCGPGEDVSAALLAAVLDYESAEALFPFVLVALAVPIALLVHPRTRRFGRYMLFGIVSTALVVGGVGAVVLWFLVNG